VENKRKKKILILCPYPYDQAAGQRLKYEQYIERWEKNDFTVILSPYMNNSLWKVAYLRGHYLKKILGVLNGHWQRFRDLFRIKEFDIIYIFHWTTPFGTHLYDFLVRKLSKRLIFDVEDFVTLSKEEEGMEGNKILSLLRSKKKTNFLIQNADHVISSSIDLNNFCLNLNKNRKATFISSSVDTDRFLPNNLYTNDKVITLGWTGTFSHLANLEFLKSILLELNNRCIFKLKLITNFNFEIKGVNCDTVFWSKEKEVEDLQDIDIGLYPLEDNAWSLGKSGLKAIQYMAFGIPTVASDIGSSSHIISHLQNGWLVKTEEEWLEALETLIKDPSLRRSLGIEARKTVQKNYSLNAIEHKYLKILNKQINDN